MDKASRRKIKKLNKFEEVGAAFSFLTRVPFLRKPIRNLKVQYNTICPYDEKTTEQKVLLSLGVAVFVSLFGGLLMFAISVAINGMSFITTATSIFTVVLLYQWIIAAYKNRTKYAVESGLSDYFLNVLHLYQSSKNITWSLTQGAEGQSYEIKKTAEYIEQIITANNADKLINDYIIDPNHNIYLKIFIEQCSAVYENGDTMSNDASVFCTNIETLRIDMMKQAIADKEKNARLTGLSLAIWLPTLGMGFVRTWGLSLSKEMNGFYVEFGLIVEIITIVAAWFINTLLNRVKNPVSPTVHIASFYYKIQESIGIFENVKDSKLIKKLHNLNNNTPAKVFYTKIFVDSVGIFIGTFIAFLISDVVAGVPIPPIQFLFCFLFSGLSLVTVAKVLFSYKVYRDNKQREVNSFQLIMLSEQNMKGAYLGDLLVKLEAVAYYYKKAINACANQLNYDREKALLELKAIAHKEKDVDFESLVDMFMAIDSIGIKKAFSELRTNRNLRTEERTLLSSIKAHNQRNLLEVACYIPSILVIGAYIIVPFLILSLTGSGNVFDSLDQMQGML